MLNYGLLVSSGYRVNFDKLLLPKISLKIEWLLMKTKWRRFRTYDMGARSLMVGYKKLPGAVEGTQRFDLDRRSRSELRCVVAKVSSRSKEPKPFRIDAILRGGD